MASFGDATLVAMFFLLISLGSSVVSGVSMNEPAAGYTEPYNGVQHGRARVIDTLVAADGTEEQPHHDLFSNQPSRAPRRKNARSAGFTKKLSVRMTKTLSVVSVLLAAIVLAVALWRLAIVVGICLENDETPHAGSTPRSLGEGEAIELCRRLNNGDSEGDPEAGYAKGRRARSRRRKKALRALCICLT
ncbi:hypothetical protein CSUI_009907, partial [Cystoisospora suis]